MFLKFFFLKCFVNFLKLFFKMFYTSWSGRVDTFKSHFVNYISGYTAWKTMALGHWNIADNMCDFNITPEPEEDILKKINNF